MKEISIFIIILFISLGGKAQESTPDTIHKTIYLDLDNICGRNYKLNFDFAGYGIDSLKNGIINQSQDDIKMWNQKIVSIERNETDTTLVFAFQNITRDNYKNAEGWLAVGCYLKTELKKANKKRIHLSFKLIEAGVEQVKAAIPTVEEMEKDEDDTLQDSMSTKVVEEGLSSIQNEFKILQYAVIAIGMILLILIIVISKHKVRNQSIKEFNEINRYVKSILITINEKIQSLEDASNGIRNDIIKLKEIKKSSVSNESWSKPSVHRESLEPLQKPREEVVPRGNTLSKGYVVDPKIDGILDKDIQSECNEYCIYEIHYISPNEAHYFINKDAKALQNIINQAYRLDYEDETKGQQATLAETVDYGILQKVEGHWRIVKPLKFIIR